MHHAITIGGLLLSLCILVGVAMAAIGVLMIFAGGMSDAPEMGEQASGQGFKFLIVGALIAIGGILGLFYA